MELRLLLAAIRRGAAILVAAVVTGAVGGALFYTTLPSHFTASASLLVDSGAVLIPGQQPYTGDPERYISDQMRLITSQQVAGQVAAKIPGFTAAEVSSATSLVHVTGTNAVTVTASADTAQVAQQLANLVATTYIADRLAPAKKLIAAQKASLAAQLNTLSLRISSLGTSTAVQATQGALLTRYNALLSQQAALTAPGATNDATAVTDTASLPTARVRSISSSEAIGGGAFAALLLGYAFALFREVRRPHVMTNAHAEVVLGREVVASLTSTGRHHARPGNDHDQIRRLTAVLTSSPSAQPRRTVAVCSAGDDVATASVARALAAAFAEQGSFVAVVDLMAERVAMPTNALTATGGASRSRIPANAMAATASVAGSTAYAAPAVVRQGVAHYRGHTETGPWSTDARDYAGVLTGNFDVVIVQTPAVLRSGTAAPVSRTADDTVLVVPLGTQLESDLRLAYQVLDGQSHPRLHLVTCKTTAAKPGRSSPSLRAH